MKYHTPNENINNNKRNRKRHVTWFNSTFSFNVKTRVEIIRKHCLPHHKFNKLFICNTIKVSYSCIPNINAEINKTTKNTLGKPQEKHPDTQFCNCTNKKQCHLNGQCLTASIFYQTNIKVNIPGYKEKAYLGVSETSLW